ncbi:DUF4453 domain-containing protein [Seohaeicola zhoushanensis]|uniref:YARHG domain-containing protein n=1 Tax=Seohaeicola zhoushanensis TaxID=1569283 RepID=A0A8J3M9C2_9RHOB|nr:DUF4453 domain-containing protein [Seohaeicola zhoushanensis]GHF59990.1 hypothetical protein GCM10017056_34260 [Seohaeicola zhoushanensis]
MRLLALLLMLLPLPAFAIEGCEDVWFTRNLLMDRAGYCFTSPLGQAIFDNSDCTTQTVTLGEAAQSTIARIVSLEAEHGCRVDTNRTWLDMPDMAFRKVLTDLPIRMDGQWGCLGWTGPVTPLYYGYHEPLHPIGQLSPGDYVMFEHEAVGDWVYVVAQAPVWGAFRSAGWLYWPGRTPCASEAG